MIEKTWLDSVKCSLRDLKMFVIMKFLLKRLSSRLSKRVILSLSVWDGHLSYRWRSTGGHGRQKYFTDRLPTFRFALAGLLAGTGAVLAYKLTQDKVRHLICLFLNMTNL